VRRGAVAILAVAALAAPLTAGAQSLPDHPGLLPRLTPEGPFPRCTAAELAAAGYPDPLHRYQWPGATIPAEPAAFGPYSLVRGKLVLPRDGLELDPGTIRYRGLRLDYAPGYDHAAMLPFVELVDWAQRDVPALLGVARDDTLRLRNPDNLEQYEALTGRDFTRLYVRQDSVIVPQPIPILHARTLAAHAAFGLVTEWLLAGLPEPDRLPVWLVKGLAEYVGEDGQHLCNFMAQYRPHGAVLLPPDRTEALLTAPPDADPERDREFYRKACYSAFLMVWELVENRGGLTRLRTFLAALGAGQAPDRACERIYGRDLAGLAGELDPTLRPEPVGDGVQPRRPHLAP